MTQPDIQLSQTYHTTYDTKDGRVCNSTENGDQKKSDFPISNYLENHGQELEYQIASVLMQTFTTFTVVDIGVERGSFIEVARKAGANKIIGFEPLPRHINHLRYLYGTTNNVSIYPYAISNCSGYAHLRIATDLSGKELDFHHTLGNIGDSTTVIRSKNSLRVQTKTLSDLIAEKILPAEIDFLKIDTDGHDLAVLEGLDRFRPKVIMAEYWDTLPDTSGISPYFLEDLASWAQKNDYDKMLIVRRHGHLESIEWNTSWTVEGDWGNVFFLRNDFECLESIKKLKDLSKKCYQNMCSYASQLANDCKAKENVIQDFMKMRHEQNNSYLDAGTVQPLNSGGPQSDVDVYSKPSFIENPESALSALHASFAIQENSLKEIQISLVQKNEIFGAALSILDTTNITLANVLNKFERENSQNIESTPFSRRNSSESNTNNQNFSNSKDLEMKEAVIQDLARAIKAYQMAHFLLSPRQSLARIFAKLKARITPRLGVLNQHPPRLLRNIPSFASKTSQSQLPGFSIVTPSFNQGGFIERTIHSIGNQNYPKIEYIVQDGGSSDDTILVLEKNKTHLTKWESRVDGGQSQAINLGFQGTSGEIMGWINSDDILLPDALTCIADYFVRHPEVDVVYGNRLLIDENDFEIGRWVLPGHCSEVLSWADYVPQETLFWRREIWEKSGGKIDESFRFAMDWDLLLRFRKVGARFGHIPRFLGAFRIHAHQKTSAVISEIGYSEMTRIRLRELGRVVTHSEVRKAVTPYLLRHLIFENIHSFKRLFK